MKTLFVGDIHAEFGLFNTLINKKQADIVIQCGDNAYFWTGEQNKEKIKPGKSQVYLLPGNHEDWNLFESTLGRRGLKPIEVERNIFYCPIGSHIIVEGTRIIFIGGADSIDKQFRTIHSTWFPQETLGQADFFFLEENYKDNMPTIIASHTCPHGFDVKVNPWNYAKTEDPTRDVLYMIQKQVKPYEWYFGHWHRFVRGSYLGTRYWGLNHSSSDDRWWIERHIIGEEQ